MVHRTISQTGVIRFAYSQKLPEYNSVRYMYQNSTAADPMLVYYYGYGQTPMADGPLKGRSRHEHGNDILTLFIDGVKVKDEGIYTCSYDAGSPKTNSTEFNPIRK